MTSHPIAVYTDTERVTVIYRYGTRYFSTSCSAVDLDLDDVILLVDIAAMKCALLRERYSRQLASDGWYRSQRGDGVW